MKIINLESVKNIRDFSYDNIKNNLLLRSAAIDSINNKDFNTLYNDYNLRTIIDLRADYERDCNLEDKYNINYYNIPLIDEEPGITKPKTDEEIILNFLKQMPNDISKGDKYIKLLQKEEAWSKIFDILLNNKDGSILICCHQGKDRTGVVCALILYLLGIDYDTIIDDYLLSNDLLKERTESLYKQVIEITSNKHIPPISKEAFMANKAHLDGVFNYLNEKYGSVDNFYKIQCNLDNEKIKIIKEKYEY